MVNIEDEYEYSEQPVEAIEQAEGEDQEDFQDEQREMHEGVYDQQFGNYPEARPKEGIFAFFRYVLGMEDSTKTANLDKWELGKLDLSVRNCEYLAKLGGLLHNKSYQDFFQAKAEIVLATSMSKKGWLPELVVSQKKFSQRTVQPIATNQPTVQKRGFLGIGRKSSQPQPQLQ